MPVPPVEQGCSHRHTRTRQALDSTLVLQGYWQISSSSSNRCVWFTMPLSQYLLLLVSARPSPDCWESGIPIVSLKTNHWSWTQTWAGVRDTALYYTSWLSHFAIRILLQELNDIIDLKTTIYINNFNISFIECLECSGTFFVSTTMQHLVKTTRSKMNYWYHRLVGYYSLTMFTSLCYVELCYPDRFYWFLLVPHLIPHGQLSTLSWSNVDAVKGFAAVEPAGSHKFEEP